MVDRGQYLSQKDSFQLALEQSSYHTTFHV
jgi:hypothetical protein